MPNKAGIDLVDRLARGLGVEAADLLMRLVRERLAARLKSRSRLEASRRHGR
jgi:hypothetical protein